MFLKRSYSPEIMDDFSIRDERVDEALIELKTINKFLGGNSTTSEGLKKIFKKNNLETKIKILDVGAGASDILLSINNILSPDIYSIDMNLRACKFTKLNSPLIEITCGDAARLPFKDEKFDIVHASLFFHHFNEEQIKNMIINFLRLSRYGIIINDLRRSVLAYLGIKILTGIFSKSNMVKNDGPLSVKRGFIKSDLKKIISDAGIKSCRIKRKWAFRWLVIIYRNE